MRKIEKGRLHLDISTLLIIFAAIICYAFEALAFHAIAENRGLDKPWLAWIPYAAIYLKGAIVDDINMRNGKTSKWRKVMFWVSTANAASLVLIVIGSVMLGTMPTKFSASQASTAIAGVMLNMVFVLALMLAVYVTIIALFILSYICLYKIYKDYSPANATVFIVLSILASICYPFLAYSIRNNVPNSIYNNN